jgi:hypothetical protein
VSKRNRGTHRSGSRAGRQGRPGRPTPRPIATRDPSPAAGTDETIDLAAAPAAGVVAAPTPTRRTGARPSSVLARHAEAEYVYVTRDLRHIGYVFGAVLIMLVVLWVAIDFLHLVTY